jgi:hypothetical protein
MSSRAVAVADQPDLDPAGARVAVALERPAQHALADQQLAVLPACQLPSAATQVWYGMSTIRRNDRGPTTGYLSSLVLSAVCLADAVGGADCQQRLARLAGMVSRRPVRGMRLMRRPPPG